MARKMIPTREGEKEVRTDGQRWLFRVGDIVTSSKSDGFWRNRRVKIEGFDLAQERIWGTIRGQRSATYCDEREGLALIKRPGMRFKVGEQVIVPEKDDAKAKVIVINPGSDHFVVEFESQRGHNGDGSWDEPWYPDQYKTDVKNRWNISERSLRKIVQRKPRKPALSAGERGRRPARLKTKTIMSLEGQPIAVRGKGTLWRFEVGDVITSDKFDPWKGKRVTVEGFDDTSGRRLWGKIKGQSVCIPTDRPEGLILLKRKGFALKVGDRVKYVDRSPAKVIVLRPSEITSVIIEFEGNQGRGHDSENNWDEPWYPEQLKTASQERFHVSESSLQRINSEGAPIQSGRKRKEQAPPKPTDPKEEIRSGQSGHGRETVRVGGSLHGFRVKDIITEKGRSTMWSNKRITVTGFGISETALWGKLDGDVGNLKDTSSDGGHLILLQRPTLLFKVTERVAALAGLAKGLKGEIIVIDPFLETFLVEFEDFFEGHNGNKKKAWDAKWFPKDLKKHSRSRLWYKAEELRAI